MSDVLHELKLAENYLRYIEEKGHAIACRKAQDEIERLRNGWRDETEHWLREYQLLQEKIEAIQKRLDMLTVGYNICDFQRIYHREEAKRLRGERQDPNQTL